MRDASSADYVRRLAIEDEAGCWLWPLAKDRGGYGLANWQRERTLAHRLSYESFVGPIAEHLTIDHLCRTRDCVNPEHLEAVTMRINVLRGYGPTAENARRTTCVAGHPFDAVNTYETRSGRRACRACNLRRVKEYQAKRRSRVS